MSGLRVRVASRARVRALSPRSLPLVATLVLAGLAACPLPAAAQDLVWDESGATAREREQPSPRRSDVPADRRARNQALADLRAAQLEFRTYLENPEAPDAAAALERVIERVEGVRTSLPDSPDVAPLVSQFLGDAYDEQRQRERALAEYTRGVGTALEGRASFNRGVVLAEQAEQALQDEGIPADADAFDPVGNPGHQGKAEVIEAQMEVLRDARGRFLDALDFGSDPAARESVAAINHRLDELQEMLDKIPPPEEQEDPEDSDDSEDEQEQDQDQEQDQQDQPQEQPPQDEEQPPQDQPEDEQPQQDQPPEEQQPQEPQERPSSLRPEEIQRLLDRLEELEEQAMRFRKERERLQHQAPEKDW